MSSEKMYIPKPAEAPNELMVNGVWLYPKMRMARVFGNEISLSDTETTILKLLMSKPDVVFTREEILDEIGSAEQNDTIDAHMKRIRKKLFGIDKLARNEFIEMVYKIGYRIPNLRK